MAGEAISDFLMPKHRSSSSSSSDATEETGLVSSKKEHVLDKDDGYREASFGSAVFNLSTTIVGAGIMSIPATMKVLGLPFGLLTIIISGFLTDASIKFLNRYSQPCKARSYGGLMADSFGTPGRTLTQLCVIVNNGGVLIVYMIIICDVLSGTTKSEHTGVLVEWAGGVTWWNSRVFVLLVTTVCILAPLTSYRHVDSLKHSSLLSMALAGVFLVIVMVVCIIRLVEGEIDPPRLLPDVHDESSFWRLFTVVPIMVTAYICHHNLHPIANELHDSMEGQMQKVCQASLLLCSSIYLATALFGYLLFGEDIASNVLSNFDADLGVPYSNVLGAVVRISYAVHIMLVFPLLNFSLRLNVDAFLFPKARPLAEDVRRFSILTIVLIVIPFFGCTVVPNIWIVFQFTGATVSVLLGFIFPGAIVLRDVPGIASVQDKLVAAIMVILAVVSSVSAIVMNVLDLMAIDHA